MHLNLNLSEITEHSFENPIHPHVGFISLGQKKTQVNAQLILVLEKLPDQLGPI
jgi:hypothetical protein